MFHANLRTRSRGFKFDAVQVATQMSIVSGIETDCGKLSSLTVF